MRSLLRPLFLAAMVMILGACREETARDISPRDLTPETLGHYCQMNLLEHPGPKAQLYLEKNPDPLFFSQVRDAIAYARAPEQVAPIVAIYVNDMGRSGATWETPGDGNWIAAEKAFYVVQSRRQGGMGAPETVPFATRDKADAFARAEGGKVLAYGEITDDMVLTPVETGDATDGNDEEFVGRLRALDQKPESQP